MKSKKKLLIIHPSLAPYRVDFFNWFSSHFNVKGLFFRKNPEGHMFKEKDTYDKLNFAYDFYKFKVNFFGVTLHLGTAFYFLRFKPDIVLLTEFNFVGLSIIIFKIFNPNLKVISVVDDIPENENKISLIRRLARRFFIKTYDGLILVNRDAVELYRKRLGFKGRCYEVPIIRNESAFDSKHEVEVREMAREIELQNTFVASKISLLFVGRYHPSKNLFSLIFAFKAVKNIHPELGLTLIGDGPLQSEISSLIANLQLQGSVQILNRKSGIELEAWYYRSDIFVLPSVYEPFGAVVDEALLQGCFVVCSSQAGAKVLIDNNNGLIFDPHKGHDELMKALIEAVCRVKTRVTRPYGILNRRIQFEKCMESLMDLTE